jgi:cyclic beta-1,2-glucan synthetase
VVLSTLALMAWILPPDGHSSATAYGTWIAPLVAVLALLPASETAVAVIHRLISESTRPHKLSRLALVDGIPAEHRVMVVIPAMITDAATIDRLVHRLVLHWLANPERHAQFALLSDWADAASEHAAGDEALLAHAVEQIRMVNARHPMPGNGEQVPRFILLHRQRTHSRSEQAWIGWERKRGKLEQLLAALATGDRSAFADLGEASLIAKGTRYLVTLYSDTQLPPGRLRELVSVAAHPDNQPRLNAAGTRVVSGYGILQPRIVTPLPALHEDTAFHRLFAGECGIDPYGSASSEVYQDLFGEGSFTGKGLLQVDAVHAVLHGRLPEGLVLSHDLLEGSIARCAAVTDITLIEDAPGHAEVAASRVHRWTRGDWQLLPFQLQPRRWPLGAVNRWKLIDNLRRSLLRPASLALLTIMMVSPGLSPWRALALVFAAFSAGPLLGALASLVPTRSAVARAHFYRQAGVDTVRAFGAGLWHLAMLMQHAAAAVNAIARALWRMTISRRRLLQWTTAASAQAAARVDFLWAVRRHPLVPPAALLLMAALALAGTPHLVLGIALCLLWGGGAGVELVGESPCASTGVSHRARAGSPVPGRAGA